MSEHQQHRKKREWRSGSKSRTRQKVKTPNFFEALGVGLVVGVGIGFLVGYGVRAMKPGGGYRVAQEEYQAIVKDRDKLHAQNAERSMKIQMEIEEAADQAAGINKPIGPLQLNQTQIEKWKAIDTSGVGTEAIPEIPENFVVE